MAKSNAARLLALVGAGLCGIALVAAGGQAGRAQMPGGQGMGHGMGMGMGMGQGAGNPVRHRIIVMGAGVPAPYTTMKNPLAADAASISAGKQIYADNCATCHGDTGAGDGEGGKELDPKPANIGFIMDKWIATDGFLMWSMSEGGEALSTAMPAYKDVLSEEQRWQVINYMRGGIGR